MKKLLEENRSKIEKENKQAEKAIEMLKSLERTRKLAVSFY